MQYEVKIKGIRPIIMRNGTAGLDVRSPAKLEMAEIARKSGTNRTASDDARLQELECQTSLWLDEKGAPTVPASALRACIETGARKLRQGPQVREGLMVDAVLSFEYNKRKYGTSIEKLGKTTQFTTPVVFQRNRLLRTRAKFDEWEVTFQLYADDELVDQSQLEAWLDIAGRRIGLGDWRPEKSGNYGRFEVVSINIVSESEMN